MTTRYQVLRHTKKTDAFDLGYMVVGTYSTVQRARNARDRKDLEHGAAVHSVREVQC